MFRAITIVLSKGEFLKDTVQKNPLNSNETYSERPKITRHMTPLCPRVTPGRSLACVRAAAYGRAAAHGRALLCPRHTARGVDTRCCVREVPAPLARPSRPSKSGGKASQTQRAPRRRPPTRRRPAAAVPRTPPRHDITRLPDAGRRASRTQNGGPPPPLPQQPPKKKPPQSTQPRRRRTARLCSTTSWTGCCWSGQCHEGRDPARGEDRPRRARSGPGRFYRSSWPRWRRRLRPDACAAARVEEL